MRPVELLRVPLFAPLPADALVAAASLARLRAHRRGARLFGAGDRCTGVVLLVDGFVRLFRVAPDGTETTVAIVRPGGLVGTGVLSGRAAYDASAEALTDVRAIELPASVLLTLGERDPTMLVRLAADLLARMADGFADAASDAQAALSRRLLRLLHCLARPSAGPAGANAGMTRLAARPSHAELARLLGADRASVTKALKGLEAQGLIEREHGHVARVGTLGARAGTPT